MLGEVPGGWTARSLADCGAWFSGGTPSRQNPEYWNGDLPWISAKSIHNFYVSDSEERVSVSGASNGTRIVPRGTILMVVRGMSLANDFRVGITTREVTFNQDLKAIVPDGTVVDALFLGMYLQGAEGEVLGMVSTASHGTCKLDTDRLGALQVALPPLPEQKKIAAILSSVDEAIQAARAVIDQTRRVKEGLLQELLTRGIGHTRFKQTEIGEIPEGWRVVRVRDLGEVVAGKARNPDGAGAKRRYLRCANVHEDRIHLDEVFVMPFTDAEFQRYILRAGDVLLNEGQSLNLVGRPAVFRGDEGTFAFQNSLVRLRADESICMLAFAYQVVRFLYQSGALAAVATQTTSIAHLGVTRFANIKVALPTLAEQKRIQEPLAEVDGLQRRAETTVERLARAKSALLQDLLTGRVRVSA